MSTFLNSYLNDIPLGYTILQMQNALVGNLTANGWQLLAQVDGDHSDLIPPATETIGTSQFREVVRIYFPNNTTITIGSYQACIADAFPQSIRLTAKNGGAVQAGVTINGVTVLGAIGSSGSSANDNLQALYYALMDSTDPTITGWTFAYDGNGTLICTAKVPAAMVTCSGNANVNYYTHAQSVLAGARSGYANIDATYGFPVTIDLTNGFVYYMEVWSRSFSLSTKCLSGVTGPIYAEYVDHTEALAVLPPYSTCSLIELVVGENQSNASFAYGKITHAWSKCSAVWSTCAIPNSESTYLSPLYQTDFHAWKGAAGPGDIIDSPASYGDASGYMASMHYWGPFTFSRLGIASNDGCLSGIKVTPVAKGMDLLASAGATASDKWVPAMILPGTSKWNGSEPNETLAMCQVVPPPSTYPTLGQALDATTAYTSILLSSTAAIPSAGGFIIGTEEFTYTGVSGASVTGVTRAANGTAQTRHFIGHVASPATWFLKINNGAVCCGPNKPV